MTLPAPTRRKSSRTRKALLSGALAVALSAGGAGAWALDRFVIQHVEISDVAAYEASRPGSTSTDAPTADTTSTAASEPVLTDTSYTSDDASINLSTVTTGS